jgi:uncharacterized protein
MAKFEIKQDKAGEYRFNLKARNGQVILSSEGYKVKPSCVKGIESVRVNSQVDERFDRKETATGHKFNLKASNGQVIGTSEVYSSVAGMENGIASVAKNAPDASVDELD